MKKKPQLSLARVFPALLMCLLCLIPTAYADMGPKPELYVTVVNAPEGTLYIDLLAEGTPRDMPLYDQSGLDQTVMERLHSLEGHGWVLVVSTGRSVPVFGDVYPSGSQNGDPVYHFSYSGLPGEFKLAAATAEEAKTTDLFTRDRFVSHLIYDWPANTLTYATPSPLFWAAQFLSTLIPTLIIEGLLLLAFGYRTKRSWAVFLIVNAATQIGLHMFCATSDATMSTIAESWFYYAVFLLPELVIWIVEAIAYALLLREREYSRWRAVGYAFAANIASYLAGYIPLLVVSPLLRSL